MSYEVNRTNFFFHTFQRMPGGTPSDFTMAMYTPLTLRKQTNYFKIKFNSVSMPYSFRQIDEYPWIADNYISWNGGPPQFFTLQFPSGSYNILEMISFLKGLLQSAINVIVPTNDLQYNFTYNQSQGSVSLQITSLNGETFTLFINNTLHFSQTITPPGTFFPYVMTTILGFFINTDITFDSTHSTNTSVYQINTAPINALFIRCNNLRVIAYESIMEPTTPSDILCKLDIITQPYTWVNWRNDLDIETRLAVSFIDQFSCQLTPINSYTPIDMHGGDWYFGLSVIEYNDPVSESLVTQFNDRRQLAPLEEYVPTEYVPTGERPESSEPPRDSSEELNTLKQELENLREALRSLHTPPQGGQF